MRSWLVGTSFIVILSLVAVVPGFADDPSKDPFYTQGVSKDAPPINTVTEHVDPFSGILTLSHTDVQLPGNGGLDMKLVRTYNSMIWGRTDVANPGLVAINELSPLGYGWTMHMGIVRNHTGNGSSNRYLPSNPVVEMPDGSKHTLYLDQRTGQMVSKEFWLYKKLLNGVSELYLPDGTVYTFESSGNTGYSVQDGGNPVAIAQCTKIQNAAKNSMITISYERNNGYPYLKTITDSAGRTVTLNYDYAQHRLTSAAYDGKTINYAYDGTGRLQSVAPPVGNAWTYSYDGMHVLNVLNYPTGGRISYTYGNVSFATGVARVYFKVVTSRSTSGRGIPAGTWTYGYSSGGSSGDVTTINGPGVTEVHAFHGWGNNGSGNVWRIGLPIRKEYNGAFSYLETYSWVKGSTVSYDQTSNAGWTNTLGQVYDLSISVPFLAAKSITRDGRTYTTSYSNYDYYGNPQTISESGDVDRTRTLTYWSSAERNIVQGKPATEVVTGDFPGTDSTTHTYDASSGNVTQINRNGVITRYGYNANGNLSAITDANSHQKTYLWSNGRMSRETNAFYQVSRQINASGTIGSETNGRNYTTTFGYDNNLRLTRITPPTGNPTTLIYPADSSSRTETRGGYSIVHSFDGFGRPTGSRDSKGIATTIAYTPYGTKDYTDSSIGDRTSFDYFGRPRQVTHKDGETITYSYSGTNVTVTDEDQGTTVLTYRAFGNPDERYLMGVTDQASKTAGYSRNVLGLLTSIAQEGANRSYGYSSKYFLSSEANPETGTITYGRDNVGNLTSKADSAGTKTYAYDSIDRLTSVVSGGTSLSYGYDNADNRISMLSPSATISYVYDAANRLTTKNETMAGRTYATTYRYDGNDNITTMTYPSGRVVNFSWNGNNQVTSIPGFVTGVSYSTSGTTAGLPTSFSSANGITTSMSYNSRQAVTAISAGSALSLGYGYDSRGNTTSMANHLDSSKSQSYSYDSLSRLTGFNGAWGSGSFRYDAIGNRTSKTVAGVATTYGYASNRLVSTSGGELATYSYTGNGALSSGTWGAVSHSLAYDRFDNLSSFSSGATVQASFGYDGDGMRVVKNSSGKAYVYHHDQGGMVISEDDGRGNLLADYVYLNGKLVARVSPEGAPPATPAAPTALAATAASSSAINISWTDNSTNETGFAIERKTGATGTYAQVATVGANVRTYSNTGLAANTNYYYRVRAVNGTVYSSYSNEANATTQASTAPAAPSALAATAASSSAINLSWADNSTNETGFAIERKTGATGTYAQVATVGANVRTYSNTGLAANTAYYYRVRAVNGTVYSTYSNEANATTRPATPAAPSALAASAASSSAINLSWTDNSTNETGFAIERKTGATGTYAQIATVGANVRTYANTGLAANTNYYYRVRAVNGTVYSSYSNEANATTRPATPAAPTVLAASAASSSAINLSWTDNSTNETGFAIERKTGATGTYAQIATVAANVRTYSNAGLAANTNYYYRVRAVNGTVYSSYSNEANATTRPATPAAPSALAAAAASSSAINLSWTDNSTNETGFAIERKTGATGTYAQIATVGANVRTYANAGLAANTNYYYRVRAVNGTAYSSYSNEANATTRPATPAAPTVLAASAASSSAINLSWTDNASNETGFAIERKTGATGTYAQIATVGANVRTYSNTGLAANTNYYYRVRAVNSTVYSSYSNEANATTRPATPAAPTVLAASAASSSAINLSWTDNSTNETGFAIERKTGATGTYAQIATVGANVRTYANAGLAANTNYYYRVRAVNGTVYSTYSNEANATTRPATPAAPTVLAASTTSSSAINLSWTDNSTNETGFAIERKTGATGTYAQIATVGANVRTYSNTGLAANTNYYYRVRAVNGIAYSTYSNEANATTRPATPAAPTVLAASAASSSAINLSWTDNSTNETGFAIERKTGATGTYAQIATVAANVRTYANAGLAANTNYYYRVRAVNGTVYSSYTNEANATTWAATPNTPRGLAAEKVSSSSVILYWFDTSTNETGFVIERKLGSTGTYTQVATVGANVTRYIYTGITSGVIYYFRVRAVNGTVYSGYSNEALVRL